MFQIKQDPNEFFNLLGLQNLSPEEKEKRFAEMMEVIEIRVFEALMQIFDEQEQSEFAELSDEDAVEKYLATKSIDIETIASEEARRYREEILNEMAEISAQLE